MGIKKGCISQSSTLKVLFVSPWSLLVLLWCLVLSFIIIITMSPLCLRHDGLSCSGDLISCLCCLQQSSVVLPGTKVLARLETRKGHNRILMYYSGLQWFCLDLCSIDGERWGVGVVFSAVSMLSRQQIPCGFDFTRGPGTAREQISEFMRKGCLRSSLLPVAQTHTAITVIVIDQWFFTGVRKLVKNLIFRICCGVMRFPGSR